MTFSESRMEVDRLAELADDVNGVPCVQIELKTLGIDPRRAMEQIADYKNDPGNGYTRTLLCFV